MVRERKLQMGLDALDAVLTSTPGILYGFFLLTKPDDDLAVYGGLVAVTASLLLKLALVALRRPMIFAKAKDETQAMEIKDRGAVVYTLKD
ncbi:MAG: hypothetical protein OYH76_18250 [Defluviicoccus sp.]|nr:hypothetical protein [Defluviicoccus sp.]MDE0277841.1 hypothetical protein [Defluviicoccus sp.]